MTHELGFIHSISFLLFTAVLYFLSVISKRLGEVLKMKKYYYLYYAGMFFTILGSISMVILPYISKYVMFCGYLFFAVGMTLGLAASIKYWGWLLKELLRG